MGFAEDIRKFQEKALLKASNKTNSVVATLFKSVVEKSPDASVGNYSTGHIKANWFTSSGSSFSTETSSAADSSGAPSLSRINTLLSEELFYARDNVVSLSNNVSYVYRAEKLGWPKDDPTNTTGWAWKGNVGPYNMVSLSVQYTLNRFSA